MSATCAEAALRYIALGFGVLPAHGKKGIVKGGWKAAATTAEGVAAFWTAHPGANIALVLPPYLCVVDIDPRNGGEESLARWEEAHGPLPETVMSTTGGGGRHLYFRCEPQRRLRHALAPGIDLIGQRGQCVEWPSRTEGAYAWVTPPAEGAYADLPAAAYEPDEPAARMNGNGGGHAPDPADYKYARAALDNAKLRLARAAKGGRNAALNEEAFGLARLAYAGAYAEDEARIALRNAARDNGSLGEDGQGQFEATFASGWQDGLANPKAIEAPVLRRGEARERDVRPIRETPRPADTGITGDALDFQEFPPLEWLIEGVLCIGATIVAGKAKIGKSWLVLDMGLAVACGTHCFGQIKATQADVLYLALEDGRRRLHSRQRKLMGTAPAPAGIKYFTTWPAIDDGLFEALASYLDAHPACRLVIVDTLGKVRGQPKGRMGVFQQDYSDLGAFQRFAAERHIALVIVHHARKQGSDDVMDQISGTTAVQAAVDTLLVLSRKRGQTMGLLNISGKDIEEEGEYALEFDKMTGRWKWLGEASKVKRDTEQGKIYDYLLHEPTPEGPTTIADALDIPISTVKSALNRMKKLGSVVNAAKGLWTVPGR